MQARRPPVVIRAASYEPGRPPSGRLVLDLELENRADRARWILLPGQLPPDDGGVFAVEAIRAAAQGGVDAARILGRGGRLAVRVSAGARVRLRDAGVPCWGSPPRRLEFQVELANEVWLGGRPLESWMDGPCRSLDDGVVGAFSRSETVSSRTTDGLEALPLELRDADGVQRLDVAVEPASLPPPGRNEAGG